MTRTQLEYGAVRRVRRAQRVDSAHHFLTSTASSPTTKHRTGMRQQALAKSGPTISKDEYADTPYLGMDERTCAAALLLNGMADATPRFMLRSPERKAALFAGVQYGDTLPPFAPGSVRACRTSGFGHYRLAIALWEADGNTFSPSRGNGPSSDDLELIVSATFACNRRQARSRDVGEFALRTASTARKPSQTTPPSGSGERLVIEDSRRNPGGAEGSARQCSRGRDHLPGRPTH